MNRPLNFLHLTTFYPPYHFGGDAMYLYRLCHALAEQGHHNDVIHCVDSYKLLHPAPPPIQFAEHPGVTRHELRSGYGFVSPFLTQQTGRPLLKRQAIREVLAARDYDVVHFHNISLLGPEVLAIKPRGTPIKLYTTHEHWLICPTHVLWKFNRRPCDGPNCFLCTVHSRRPPQMWRYTGLLDRMASHVDQFVAPSRFTARMHADRGFSRPVGHLPYFIDRVDDDWQNPRPRPQERPYFLFVGRLERIKGLQTLISLWNRVPEYDLLVAGDGDYRAELEAMAAGNPRIRFLGPCTQKDLGALYYHALACIVPSITFETFGMIIIESFARRTPVIARDLGALPEVIQDSGGGFTYRTDEELLSAIGRIAESPGIRAELGCRGYAAFSRYWCREAHLALYFDYLHRIARDKFGRIPWTASPDEPASLAARKGGTTPVSGSL